MRPLPLELGAVPTRAELKSLVEGQNNGGVHQTLGGRLLKEMDEGRPLPRSYPYPVEVWRLGGSSCGSHWAARSSSITTCGSKDVTGPKRG